MYFKNGNPQPKMVSTIRAPLLPDGYTGTDASQNNSIMMPMIILLFILAVVAFLIIRMKK